LEEDVQGLNEAKEGVYFGWARLNHQDVYECVASVGWNPFFQLDKKTCEPHLLHKFTEDFYGANIELCLCGYIRGEKNFSSLDDLIRAIQWDISVSKVSMTLANFTQANCFKI
jgi:riboflavin kinase